MVDISLQHIDLPPAPATAADPQHLSPLNLAYIGDSVYALLVRTRLVATANRPTHALTRIANRTLSAAAQSAAYHALQPFLNSDEAAIMKRGRNAKSATRAKNATVADYRCATGLEALFGFLYLTNQQARLLELFDICWNESEKHV